IRQIQVFCMQDSGKFIASPGRWRAGAPAAASSNRLMAATPGRRLRNQGLPRGTIGIVGITVSPANPDRLWAIVEAEDGGVFRSDNGGKTWTKTNEQRNLRQRAWYYSRIYADPKNADEVYVLNTGFYRSNDGGRTFNGIG